MPKRRKFLGVDEKCRICLSDDGYMSYIFSENLKPKINDLAECSSIHINDDEDFPKNICHVCLYKLDMWIDFKNQFVRSDVMLREHLEGGSKVSDDDVWTTKRKHEDQKENADDSSSELGNAKKIKSNLSIESLTESVSVVRETDSTLTMETSGKLPGDSNTVETKVHSENTSDVITASSTVCAKVKQITGRRVKTTERREASTKRWVARKKALLAATGENDSDTDSMSSDDSQLSPVQKARAKCNAEKVVETRRRITKNLQNFDNNASGYYGTKADSDNYVCGDNTDSDSRKNKTESTRTEPISVDGSRDAHTATNNFAKNAAVSSSPALKKNSVNSSIDDDDDDDDTEQNVKSAENFVSCSVRSELVLGDATFIVTSTLLLAEPRYFNNLTKDSGLPDDECQQERNTDIIDAVQLRRVTPKSPLENDRKFIERCLNIEVEGTELESLKRVQAELANFVEKDIKDKLSNVTPDNERIEAKPKDSLEALDQQLKTIVEKTIKKNLDNSTIDKVLIPIDNRGNNTFTSPFVKAALRSKIFQPRVLLVRLDMNPLKSLPERSVATKDPVPDAKRSRFRDRLGEQPLVALGKRKSVQPARFADYNTSPFDSDSDEIPNRQEKATIPATVQTSVRTMTPRCSTSSNVKTYGPASTKHGQITTSTNARNQRVCITVKREDMEKSMISDNDGSMLSSRRNLGNHENDRAVSASAMNSSSEKHICGVCGDFFGTRREVEIHFRAHKNPTTTTMTTMTTTTTTTSKQTKQKMMRCKRCHEIVEARYVKLHVCRSSRNCQKCYVCDVSFRNENLLVRHLESHNLDAECKIERVQNPRARDEPEIRGDQEYAKITSISTTTEKVEPADESKESYTCFVCDKTFTDEEILKDHLQKHCDDMSEDERTHEKEQYQCAICGETLESEDALESHVEKHLFDDEDDNPNLISISVNDNEKISKDEETGNNHVCEQCEERFDSEMLLMLHMQGHEEEVAIAEWEKREIENSRVEEHTCVICDEIFTTEEELCEHLDIHNENSHTCILCDKPFLTLEELQNHVNTH